MTGKGTPQPSDDGGFGEALEGARQALGSDGAEAVAGALKFAADQGYFGRSHRRPGRPRGSFIIRDASGLLDEYRRQRKAIGRGPTLPEFAAAYRTTGSDAVSEDTVRAALDRFGMAWPLDLWLEDSDRVIP